MQKVFDNYMCTHVWAQQCQQSGRGSHGSVYFEGPALYSYGTHYLTGYILDGVALLNSDSYSVTTSKHKGYAWRATSNRTQYGVPALTALRDALRAGVTARSKITVRQWLRDTAETCDIRAALFIAGAFGIGGKSVIAERKRGLAKAAKEAERRKAEARAYDIREARMLANLDQAAFDDWAHRYAHVFEPQSFSYVAQMEKNVAAFAKTLNRGARFGAKVMGVRRVATLRARRAALLDWAKGMAERAAERDRLEALAAFAAWRTAWRAAGDDIDARASAMRNAPAGWRLTGLLADADLAEFEAATAWQREHRAEIWARENAARREREADQFAQWQRGENVACPYSYRATPDGAAYVRRRGDNLETSQGAVVPWPHAVKAFRFIRLCRERGEAWQANGHTLRVGLFTVSSISAQGDMRAGCHTFRWAQMEALARSQGVYDAATPSADAIEPR